MKVIILTIVLATLLQGIASEVELRYIDDTQDPCDDFYKFACGNFDKYYERPANKSLDLFTLTENELVKIGKDILSSPKHQFDPIALKKAKSAYKACVDVEKLDSYPYYRYPEKHVIETYGGMPLVGDTTVEKISWKQIGEIAGKFGVHQLFQFLIRNSDPEKYLLIMYPDSLDHPELIRPRTVKTYDELLEESFKRLSKTKQKFGGEKDPLDVFLWNTAKHLLRVYNHQKSDEELQKDLDDMKQFMAQILNGGIVDGDMIKIENALTLGELQKWTEEQFGDEVDMNWIDFFTEHFKWATLNVTEDFMVYLLEKESVYGILNLVRKTDPNVVKNFILFRTFLYMAPDSDIDMRQAFQEYYTSMGLEYYDRSEYCARKLLDVVDSASLSFAVANDFINYHFNMNKIPEAIAVINSTIRAFESLLPTYEWVDQESYEAIFHKLHNIVWFLGFPDFVENKSSLDHFYENVRICDWDSYGNAQRIRAFKQAYAFSEYRKHDVWLISLFEVNAYARQASNRVTAPLSMLQNSYFDGLDPAYDYARFGSIVSHELIHHFDPSGIRYDENGQQNGLLSNSTETTFQEKCQCLVDQYNKYYVEEVDRYVNGHATLNENLADIGGLKHSFLAFKQYIKDIGMKESNGYTLEQQFFINYATNWCSLESYDYLKKLVETDSHTPSHFRVVGTLSNMKEFSDAFNCPVGSNMNPENKCIVW